MLPQLFLNYKLKSVAHLPWRQMSYKFLNTIIDDLFAFVIKVCPACLAVSHASSDTSDSACLPSDSSVGTCAWPRCLLPILRCLWRCPLSLSERPRSLEILPLRPPLAGVTASKCAFVRRCPCCTG